MPTEVQLMRRFLDSADDVLPRPFSGFNDWDGVFFIHYMAVFFSFSLRSWTRALSILIL